MPHVIATAGHVDHGKSTLILALTGIEPDRLAEEKARGLTIDLGFAWTTLPSGTEVGFVDVPGHERFVHNMLAGVGGVDCALLVVDATEGWRPQSEEHLAILDLLGITTGVVALTKTDLAGAAEVAAVAAQVGARLAATGLAGAEIVATAAPAGTGLDELRAALDQALELAGEPPDRGRPRLPVDRVFSLRGAGTIVTGTLSGGTLRAESEAELLPAGRRVRIRGLQGHGRALDLAVPAHRLAANLGGVAVEEVHRGDVLAVPGQWRATRVADARLRCLDGEGARPLRGRGAYLLYAGAAECPVRLQPLDAHEVPPGQSGLVRLHLDQPLVLDAFEPVVLRDSGRGETVGGGRVLDPFPATGRIHGTTARVVRTEQLEAREAAGRDGLLERAIVELGAASLTDLPRLAADGPERTAATRDALVDAGRVVRTRSTAWSPPAWEAARQAVLEAVANHHRTDPLAPGLPAQAARRAATGQASASNVPGLTSADVAASLKGDAPPSAGAEVVEALVAEGLLVADGPVVRMPEHGVRLDPGQEAVRRGVERALAGAGINVLSDKELAAIGADRHLTGALARLGVLVQVGQGQWLGAAALDEAVGRLRAAFPGGRAFAANEAKEALGTTRRTAIPVLEHLDRTGVTIRAGDRRRLADAVAGTL